MSFILFRGIELELFSYGGILFGNIQLQEQWQPITIHHIGGMLLIKTLGNVQSSTMYTIWVVYKM